MRSVNQLVLFPTVAAGCQHPAHAGHARGQGEQDAIPSGIGEHACWQVRVPEGGVRRLGCAAQRVVHADDGGTRRYSWYQPAGLEFSDMPERYDGYLSAI